MSVVGEALADRVDELTDDVQDVIIDLIPDLRADATGILHHSIRENIDTALHALASLADSTEAVAPAAAIEYAEALAQADVPPTVLIRAYRVGQTRFLRRCIEEVLRAPSNDQVDVLVTLQIVESVSTRLDWVVEQVYVAYENARELKFRDRSAVLTGRVRDLLRGRTVDIDDAEAALAYRLRQSHVALILWIDGTFPDALTRLRRFTNELGHGVGCAEQGLFVASDEHSAWAWLPTKIDFARAPSSSTSPRRTRRCLLRSVSRAATWRAFAGPTSRRRALGPSRSQPGPTMPR